MHLWSHAGGKLNWDEARAAFATDPERPPLGDDGQGFVVAAGAAADGCLASEIMSSAVDAGCVVARDLGLSVEATAPDVAAPGEAPLEPI